MGSDLHIAIIPAGGLGTRLLPLTKAIPKEMLPLANKPVVQYAVEEAAASGIDHVIVVINQAKSAIQRHFCSDPALEALLAQSGKTAEASVLRELSQIARISIVLQERPDGLAHAIQCAQSHIGDQPFAVILPDAIIDAPVPCVKQLLDCYTQRPGCYVATRLVDLEAVRRFGILQVDSTVAAEGILRVLALVEKPQPHAAPSRYGVYGRYLLEPEIFSYIARTRPDARGELQLTDALNLCCREQPVYGALFQGRHYDVGDKLEYLEAVVAFGLKDTELAQPFRNHLRSLKLD